MSSIRTSRYRPDIDGLRAIAVVPVVLFHAGFSDFNGMRIAPGGFVGVDIFFVISGYLISGAIYAQISTNSYSVVGFYARRIRRLFPALCVVYLACLAWGTARGIPADIEEIRNATIASILFVSNLYFAAGAGYFDAAIQSNPLLHTWSLSIEEQFYILLPLVLLAMRGLSPKGRIIGLSLIVAVSLATSVYLGRAYPDVGYYSLSARTWELGIGALLAIARPRIHSRAVAEALGLAGLVAIAVAILTFDKTTEFPSYTALLPTLGAAAIILSGTSRQTLVARGLSLAPIRWIGLISYSLYLWHWPILVISRLEGFTDRQSTVVAIVLCFAIAWLSWRFVEQPFRSNHIRASPPRAVAAGTLAMAAVLAVALGSRPLNAIFMPITEGALALARFDPSGSLAHMGAGTCFLTSNFNSMSFYRPDLCLTEDPSRPDILLIGDSHAAQYAEALRSLNPDVHLMQATASGCLPLLDTVGQERCVDLWNFVTGEYLPANPPDAIVVVGRWPEGTGAQAFATARDLLNYAPKVVVVGPNQEFDTPFPRLLIKANVAGDEAMILDQVRSQPREADREFLALSQAATGIVYVSYFDLMCATDCPRLSSAGEPVIVDNNHLSLSAATDVVEAAGPVLDLSTR